MTVTVYSNLKQQVQFAVLSHKDPLFLVNKLKSLFKDDINSPRRYEQIKTFGELIGILETRDVLSPDNIKALERIVKELPLLPAQEKNDLIGRIRSYEDSIVQTEQGNFYARKKLLNNVNHTASPAKANQFNNNPYGNMSTEKRHRILRTVIEEIGNEWRDLARNLRIREKSINDADYCYRTLSQKANKILEIYLELKAEPDKWFFELCDALEKTRRKDLSNELKKILLMNI